MLIRRATLLDGSVVDIRVDTRIDEVAPALEPADGERVLDAALGLVIPGLHDHHVHVHSAAAAADSVRVGVGEVHDGDDLARVLAAAEVGEDGWIRAVGYHEVVAGSLDRHGLDALSPAVPVRIQHRSGILWTLNSAGLAAVGLADHPDGRLRSADRSWSDALKRRDTSVDDLSRRLCRYGVTGITDATPDLDITDMVLLAEVHRRGGLRQHVHHLAPGKRILHDEDLDLGELTGWIGRRHDEDAPVALHCVT
ncbi:MAG: amidohydrolase family protein, partial [Mycobacterium sp.]